jgi:hypothetical protein
MLSGPEFVLGSAGSRTMLADATKLIEVVDLGGQGG